MPYIIEDSLKDADLVTVPGYPAVAVGQPIAGVGNIQGLRDALEAQYPGRFLLVYKSGKKPARKKPASTTPAKKPAEDGDK